MPPGRYVPECGDVVWLDLNPRAGHEQAGRRPVLVLSPAGYNRLALAVVCPITSKAKGYPFEVRIPPTARVVGVVLSNHLASLDWAARNAELMDRLPRAFAKQVATKFVTLLPLTA
jgi:mRNA interferase MazF